MQRKYSKVLGLFGLLSADSGQESCKRSKLLAGAVSARFPGAM